MARQRNSSQERIFNKDQIDDFNHRLGTLLVTQQGVINLGNAISHIKDMRKPDWVPASREHDGDKARNYVSDRKWEEEREKEWSFDVFADVLNREYDLWAAPEKVSRDAISRIINPKLNAKPPNIQLLSMIAGLKILKNPKTGIPYDFVDFLAISKEVLDWRTGEYKLPSIGSE